MQGEGAPRSIPRRAAFGLAAVLLVTTVGGLLIAGALQRAPVVVIPTSIPTSIPTPIPSVPPAPWQHRPGTCPETPAGEDVVTLAKTGPLAMWPHHPPGVGAPGAGVLAVIGPKNGDYRDTSVYLLDTEDGSSCELMKVGGGAYFGFAWSPSGDALAMDTFAIGASGLRLWAASGLLEVPQAINPSWSVDGSSLAVEAYSGGFYNVKLVPADGSGWTGVTCHGGACGSAAALRWSPDGTRIAAPGNMQESQAIVVGTSGSTSLRAIDAGGATGLIDWLDNSTILATTAEQSGVVGLIQIPVDQPEQARSAGELPAGAGALYPGATLGSDRLPYAFSHDLASIAAVVPAPGGGEQLVVAGRSGSSQVLALTHELADGFSVTGILWSPDDSGIAFSLGAKAPDPVSERRYIVESRGIWIVNRDGSGLRQVTDQPFSILTALGGGRRMGGWRPVWD